MKVVHLASTEPGGAGISASRLHQGLLAVGVDSRMAVLHKRSQDPAVRVVPSPDGAPLLAGQGSDVVSPLWPAAHARWNQTLARHPRRPEGLEMFSDPRGLARLELIEELRDADVVNLHWTAGMIDFPADTVLAGLPVVWTLHDMNPFTGGCHYDVGCGRWRGRCGACPQLGSASEMDDSRLHWLIKREAYGRLDLTCVAPSRWLVGCIGSSSLLGGRERHLIPYGLPLDVFRPRDRAAARAEHGVADEDFLLLFGADAIFNQRKGLIHLLRALRELARARPDLPITLGAFGATPGADFSALGFRVKEFGFVTDPEALAGIYSMADAFVLPSEQDNLPNVMLEAMACGLPVVGFDMGGAPDVVTPGVNGFLAAPGDVAGLVEGLCWAMARRGDRDLRRGCRRLALERYPLQRQGRDYLDLYESILERRAHEAGKTA
jgi:glycosyltransferase involved in cell wall biosynthesis